MRVDDRHKFRLAAVRVDLIGVLGCRTCSNPLRVGAVIPTRFIAPLEAERIKSFNPLRVGAVIPTV